MKISLVLLQEEEALSLYFLTTMLIKAWIQNAHEVKHLRRVLPTSFPNLKSTTYVILILGKMFMSERNIFPLKKKLFQSIIINIQRTAHS